MNITDMFDMLNRVVTTVVNVCSGVGWREGCLQLFTILISKFWS